MQTDKLYPELVDYIFECFPKFMTRGEKWASRTTDWKAKTVNKRLLEMMQNNVLLNNDDNL